MTPTRFSDKPELQEYGNVAIPVTNMGDNKDYKMNGSTLAKVLFTNKEVWNIGQEVIKENIQPLMTYTDTGSYFFDDLSGNTDLPTWVEGHSIGYATMFVENGKNGGDQTFRKYTMFYADLTRNTWEVAMRGRLFNGQGEPQGDTQWQSSNYESEIAKTLEANATMDGSIIATVDDFPLHSFGLENVALQAGDNIDTIALGTYGTYDWSIYSQIGGTKPFNNPFKLFCFKGGVNEPKSKQQIAIEWTSEDIAIRHTQNGTAWTSWTKLSDYAKKSDITDGTIKAGKAIGDEDGTNIKENYAKKSDISNVYNFKGSVATESALPKENNKIGDVYDVQDTGINYAWDGTKWDALGQKINLDLYALKTDVPSIKVNNSVDSDKLGGKDANLYALKAEVGGITLQDSLDVNRPVGSTYPSLNGENPNILFRVTGGVQSWWNKIPGKDGYIRVRQSEYFEPYKVQITTLGSGRNLIDVLGASSVKDAFAKLKARVELGDYRGLQLGDYIDLPSLNTGSRSGAGTISNNPSWQNLRFEIAASDFYNYGGSLENHGILFIAKNVVYEHRMNSSDTNAGGYLASELFPIVNEDFTAGITEAIGFSPKEIHRTLDKGYGASGSNWSTEKCFIPTELEMFGNSGDDRGNWYGMRPTPQHTNVFGTNQITVYPKRGNNAGRVKKYQGSYGYPWEASSYKSSSARFALVDADGGATHYYASNTNFGVSPAFYIG